MAFEAGKNGSNFISTVSFGLLYFQVSFLTFKCRFWSVSKIGSGHCANRAVMFCWFGAKKVKTKVQCQKQGRA